MDIFQKQFLNKLKINADLAIEFSIDKEEISNFFSIFKAETQAVETQVSGYRIALFMTWDYLCRQDILDFLLEYGIFSVTHVLDKSNPEPKKCVVELCKEYHGERYLYFFNLDAQVTGNPNETRAMKHLNVF